MMVMGLDEGLDRVSHGELLREDGVLGAVEYVDECLILSRRANGKKQPSFGWFLFH